MFQNFVGLRNTQFAGFRHVETALARVLHEDLHQPAVVVRFGEGGVQLDRFRVVVVGFGQFSRQRHEVRAIVIGVGEVWVELRGLVQVGDRLVVVVGARLRVLQPLGRIGLDGDALVGVVDRRDEVDHLRPRGRPVQIEERVGRILVDGRRERPDGIGVLLDERLGDASLEQQLPRCGFGHQLAGVTLVQHDERVGGHVALAGGERQVPVVDAAAEIGLALRVVASRRDGGEAVGRAEREAEERQQRKAVVGALGGDASEGAAGDVGIERQQAVEAVRRVGVDRVGAVAQAGLVFGDLALCDVAVAARTALVFDSADGCG